MRRRSRCVTIDSCAWRARNFRFTAGSKSGETFKLTPLLSPSGTKSSYDARRVPRVKEDFKFLQL
jgi:hypothetical protein